MDLEIGKKWVFALRSGDYKQGRGYLRSERSGEIRYCCLGVLLDIQGIESVKEKDDYFFKYNGVSYIATPPLSGYAGLNEEELTQLCILNDLRAKSFDEIADYIESKIKC